MADFDLEGVQQQDLDETELDVAPQQFGASPGNQSQSVALRPQARYNAASPAAMPMRERQSYPPRRTSVRSEASKGSSYVGDDDEQSHGGGIFRCFHRCFGRGAEQAVDERRLEDFMHDIELCFEESLGKGKAPLAQWLPLEMDRLIRAASHREAQRQVASGVRLERLENTLAEVHELLQQQALEAPARHLEDRRNESEDLLTELADRIERRLGTLEERLEGIQTSEARRPVTAKMLEEDDSDNDVQRSAGFSGKDARIYNYRQVMEATRGEAEKFTRSCKDMQGKTGRTLEKMEADLGRLFQLASQRCDQFTQSQNQVLAQYQQLLDRLGKVTTFVETCGKHLDAARADIVTVPRELQGLRLNMQSANAAAMQQAVGPQVIPTGMQLRDPLHEILREIEGVKAAVQQCFEAKQRMLSVDDLQDIVRGVVQDRRRQGQDRHPHYHDGPGHLDMDRSAGHRHRSLPRK